MRKKNQVACQADVNDNTNIEMGIYHLYSCCSSFGFGLFNNRRLSWYHSIILLLNIDLNEKGNRTQRIAMMPPEHSRTLDAGLRLPARDAGFAAALEAGFPPASGTTALEAGFPVVSVGPALEA